MTNKLSRRAVVAGCGAVAIAAPLAVMHLRLTDMEDGWHIVSRDGVRRAVWYENGEVIYVAAIRRTEHSTVHKVRM
jgi:hypothetical protein